VEVVHALLHALDHRLVFALDAIETHTRAALEPRRAMRPGRLGEETRAASPRPSSRGVRSCIPTSCTT
jgi:hypothetical protein